MILSETKLCFSGYKGCGKDYLASILIDKYGFQRRSFSDQVKLIASTIYPWLKKDYPPFEKEISVRISHSDLTLPDVTPREVWETINNLRNIQDDIFVVHYDYHWNEWQQRSRSIGAGTYDGPIIITDGRMKCELNYVKKQGYKIIFIDGKSIFETKSKVETDIELWKEASDYIFVNDQEGPDKFLDFCEEVLELKM